MLRSGIQPLHCVALWRLLSEVWVWSVVPLGISRLQNRFVVGGYVASVWGVANIHWVEELLHWQRGNSRRVRRILASYLPPSSIYPPLTEKIGPPLIILVSDFQRLLGEHPHIHPIDLLFFFVLYRKSQTKIFAIALDHTVWSSLAADRVSFCVVFPSDPCQIRFRKRSKKKRGKRSLDRFGFRSVFCATLLGPVVVSVSRSVCVLFFP